MILLVKNVKKSENMSFVIITQLHTHSFLMNVCDECKRLDGEKHGSTIYLYPHAMDFIFF